MTKLEQIQSSIEKLSARELAELLLDENAKAGKLAKLMADARANLARGLGEAL